MKIEIENETTGKMELLRKADNPVLFSALAEAAAAKAAPGESTFEAISSNPGLAKLSFPTKRK